MLHVAGPMKPVVMVVRLGEHREVALLSPFRGNSRGRAHAPVRTPGRGRGTNLKLERVDVKARIVGAAGVTGLAKVAVSSR